MNLFIDNDNDDAKNIVAELLSVDGRQLAPYAAAENMRAR